MMWPSAQRPAHWYPKWTSVPSQQSRALRAGLSAPQCSGNTKAPRFRAFCVYVCECVCVCVCVCVYVCVDVCVCVCVCVLIKDCYEGQIALDNKFTNPHTSKTVRLFHATGDSAVDVFCRTRRKLRSPPPRLELARRTHFNVACSRALRLLTSLGNELRMVSTAPST